MKDMIHKLRSHMAVNIIGAVVLLLAVFGAVVSLIGYMNFTSSFKREYSVSTYHMADTAALQVNGDHLEEYLGGWRHYEYELTKEKLDDYCQHLNVSLIYVILVDRTDYGRFTSVFNLVNNSVDDTSYVPWELGYVRDTTNDEYREKYKSLYDHEVAYETVYRTNPSDGSHPHITTLVPVENSEGDVAGILCVQRPIRELNEARRPYLMHIALSTLTLAVIMSVLAAIFIRLQVITPVRKVADEATRFARENTKGAPLGEISKYTEIESLAGSIDTMETDMLSYMEHMTSLTAEQERIGTELTLATRIQLGMLPSVFPAFPGRGEFDLYASMDPAKEVGGDFYDFFLIDDDHLCLEIADVSGKGVPAALFMMASKIILKSNALLGLSPAEILTRTNDTICSNNTMEMFVTVWIGILEISTGRLTAANAGHEYPMMKLPGADYELLKDKHGFVVGGMEDVIYKDYELQLEPGTEIFLYTDGLAEAADADDRMFGMDRILDVLRGAESSSPQQILERMQEAVDGFVQEAEQFDDLTMLSFVYKGRDPSD